jgi:hypothetical protein
VPEKEQAPFSAAHVVQVAKDGGGDTTWQDFAVPAIGSPKTALVHGVPPDNVA